MATKTSTKYKTFQLERPGYTLSSNPGYWYNSVFSSNPTLMTSRSSLTGSTGFDGKFRPVLHTQSSCALYGGLASGNVLQLNSPHTLTERNLAAAIVIARANSRMGAVSANHSIPQGVDWSGLGRDALSNMLPSLSDGSSVLNFLVELRDFRHLGRSILKYWRAVRVNFINSFLRLGVASLSVLWSAFGSKPWDSKPKKASAAYLAWKFAWQPFVRDVKRLVSKILAFREKVKQFERRQNQRQQRYWGKTLKATYASTLGGSYTDSLSVLSTSGVFASTLPDTYRFTAVMRYRYHMDPAMLATAKGLGGALDVLGINANPAIIWNAIPFSFVVDWFVSVGTFLEKVRVDNVRPIVEISDFSSSVKAVREYKDTLTGTISYGGYSKTLSSPFGIYTRSEYYERRVGVPSLFAFNNTPGMLSGTKVALSGALLHLNFPSFKMTTGHY